MLHARIDFGSCCCASVVTGLVVAAVPAGAAPSKVTINTPPNGAIYEVGETITPSFSCLDEDKWWAKCVGPSAIDTSTVGPHSFRVDRMVWIFAWWQDGSLTHNYTVIPPPDTTPPVVTITSPEDGEVLEFGRGRQRGIHLY